MVSKKLQGQRLGQRLINVLSKIAWANDCYKCILVCKPELDNFYSKVGFHKNGIQMSYYKVDAKL